MQHKEFRKTGLWTALFIGAFLSGPVSPATAESAAPIPKRKPDSIRQEPAFHPVPASIEKSDSIPLPPEKPAFHLPDTGHLLSFGAPPIPPANRPVPIHKDLPLSVQDASLYKQIFSYQTSGNWSKADQLITRLQDLRLRGHILYQRYMHPTAYRAQFDELIGWLDLYADHPGADRVYKLALARMPANFKGSINKPRNSKNGIYIVLDVMYDKEKPYISRKNRSDAQKQGIKTLKQHIRRDIANGAPTRAYKRLLEDPRAKYLDAVEYDQVRSRIASSYMFSGKIDPALELAHASARRSGAKAPLAGWVGGLTSWRKGKYRDAARYFSLTATSPYASPWMSTAGAYWASRAHTRAGNVREVSKWLELAATHPRTFYGILAVRALGWHFDFNWEMPAFTEKHRQTLLNNPAGYRAIALAAAGQYHLAEAEMRQIAPQNNNNLVEALVAYTHHAGLPSFSMQLAGAFKNPQGGYYDAALYPLAPWQTNPDHKLDEALILAFIRQESKFNPVAESRSGATGLMQIMPTTASFVTGSHKYKNREGQHVLKDPHINLEIGQNYINSLLSQESVNNDLFSLSIAYNAGPGNLRRWKREMGFIKDPLLFVESIPMAETRNFVERVMANYWIYRIRMGQPTPSLDAVAQGDRAHYVRLDHIRQAEARTPAATDRPSYRQNNGAAGHYPYN